MTLETDLARTFAAHEHLAPDADVVLAEVRARTDHRRSYARPLAIAASVTALAAVVGGVVVLTSGDDSPTRSAAPATTATASTAATASTPAASTTNPTPATPAGPATLTMPFDVGNLPDGTVSALTRRTQAGAESDTAPPVIDGEYSLTVTSATRSLDVDVQQMPGALGPTGTFKTGPGVAVTIAGRPGFETANAGGTVAYELYFVGPDGRTYYLTVGNSTTGPARPAAGGDELRDAGRRIAESVRTPGTTRLAADYGVGYVPAGLTLRTFSVSARVSPTTGAPTGGTQTSYGLGDATTVEDTISIFPAVSEDGPFTPGRPVQGHATKIETAGGQTTLLIEDAVSGTALTVEGAVPASELYAVADGLVLPS